MNLAQISVATYADERMQNDKSSLTIRQSQLTALVGESKSSELHSKDGSMKHDARISFPYKPTTFFSSWNLEPSELCSSDSISSGCYPVAKEHHHLVDL